MLLLPVITIIINMLFFLILCYLFSTTTQSAVHGVLARRKPTPPSVILVPLEALDRRDIVRKTLAEYRKHLDERPMNDQMR